MTMLFLVTFISLMTFSFMQVSRMVRRVDLTLYGLVPSVFEAAVDLGHWIETNEFVFDSIELVTSIERHLVASLSDLPITYSISLIYQHYDSKIPCESLCDAVIFEFEGNIFNQWPLLRSFEVYIIDYENNVN